MYFNEWFGVWFSDWFGNVEEESPVVGSPVIWERPSLRLPEIRRIKNAEIRMERPKALDTVRGEIRIGRSKEILTLRGRSVKINRSSAIDRRLLR